MLYTAAPHKILRQARLVLIDPEDDDERRLLRRQRVICGWKKEKVPAMCGQMSEGRRILFWIGVPTDGPVGVSSDGRHLKSGVESAADGESENDGSEREWTGMLQLKARPITGAKSPMINGTASWDRGWRRWWQGGREEEEEEEEENNIPSSAGHQENLPPSISTARTTRLRDVHIENETASPRKNAERHGGDDEQQLLIPVGHISIDAGDFDENPSEMLFPPDGRTLSLTTLFILPAYRKYGLGTWAMHECERLIRAAIVVPPQPQNGERPPQKSQSCNQITLTTLHRRHTQEDGPEGRGMFERTANPRKVDEVKYIGGWYAKLGYELYHEQRKYLLHDSHGEVTWWAEFWRKTL
ncbi:MAG: hypothetical protein Q9162_000844 [Coniocarpon cinnabarinum]